MKKKMKSKASKKARPAEQSAPAPAAEPADKKRSKVDLEEFTRVWTKSPTVPAAADKLGLTVSSACAIAGRLRRKGVPLKKFPRRGPAAIDVKHLSRIAAGKGE